jgi:thioredoxin 1
MPSLILQSGNRQQLAKWLEDDQAWVVACLCAAWCETCQVYRDTFDELAARHPEHHFVWIDIEDHADLAGDFDVENFPTLLIQHGELVVFFGAVLPEIRVADRLLRALFEKDLVQLQAETTSSAERRIWQRDCNLRSHLANLKISPRSAAS